jgi:hypothetical protein
VLDSGEEIQRIVAVGDVHGEAAGFKAVLYLAGVLESTEEEVPCSWRKQEGKICLSMFKYNYIIIEMLFVNVIS